MTDTPEAVRLAYFAMRMQTRLGSCRESCNDYDKMAWDDYDAMASLLRRIPELEAENAAWRKQADTLTHQVICCGVAASHPDPELTKHGAYAGKWNSAQAEEVRKLRAERDQLRAELEKVRCLDVDDLAQFIRQIEGRHNMGAGALAELIVEWFYATQTPPNADQKGQ